MFICIGDNQKSGIRVHDSFKQRAAQAWTVGDGVVEMEVQVIDLTAFKEIEPGNATHTVHRVCDKIFHETKK